MAEIRIDDPDLYERKTVDGEGRIYVGREFANKDVKIVIEAIEETEEGNAEATATTAD